MIAKAFATFIAELVAQVEAEVTVVGLPPLIVNPKLGIDRGTEPGQFMAQ
jgi:hypothetical protein